MPSDRQRSVIVAIGVFLLVGALYAAVSSGRIDMIDGQYRFEVGKNLLDKHSLQIHDPFLRAAVPGVGGSERYSPYGISGSIVSLPLLAWAKISGAPSRDREQFFFSLTSPLFGAATAALLFLFMATLDVPPQRALFWTLAAAVATLAFPVATSVFDQTQHGFFVLAGCYLAFLAARRDSLSLAAAGGAMLAVLVNFQVTDALMLPTIGIASLAAGGASPRDRRRALARYIVFLFVGGLGLLVWAGLNQFRYGSLLVSGLASGGPDVLGNPLVGLAGLFLSPGKSIFLYSPLTALGMLGIYRLYGHERRLGQAIVVTGVAYTLLIASLSFYGGDWCWGPRYFVVILPLVALGLPMNRFDSARGRLGVGALVASSLAIQLLGISLDQHRFFYARSLPDFFWSTDRRFYFRDSALFARPGELLTTITDGVPAEADRFRPGPYPALLTYPVFGPGPYPQLPPPLWMRRYRVFWLPRPWPLWMSTIPATQRPIDVRAATAALLGLGLAGSVMVRMGSA
jgi:hypothetical protein